jgi:hypothetical protein
MKLKMTVAGLPDNINSPNNGGFSMSRPDTPEELPGEQKEEGGTVPVLDQLVKLNQRMRGLSIEKMARLARVAEDETVDLDSNSD